MMCQNILRAKAAAALFLFVPGLSFARALFGRAADESSNEEGPEGSSIPVFRKGFWGDEEKPFEAIFRKIMHHLKKNQENNAVL